MPSAKENARRLLRAHGRWWNSKAGRKSFAFQQKAFGCFYGNGFGDFYDNVNAVNPFVSGCTVFQILKVRQVNIIPFHGFSLLSLKAKLLQQPAPQV